VIAVIPRRRKNHTESIALQARVGTQDMLCVHSGPWGRAILGRLRICSSLSVGALSLSMT
jgi:hypothetical protein